MHTITGARKVAAYDPDGQFLAAVAPGYAARAIERGEASRNPHGITLRPSAIERGKLAPLPPEVRRRLFLQKHGARR